ncbi:hypothetical protein [Halorhodospira halochloris]|nr:hypothetical protein [Halorhodospira halochloris]
MEDAVNPYLEAQWRQLWRQDPHTWVPNWLRRGVIRGTQAGD